jgi:hypothetical protein
MRLAQSVKLVFLTNSYCSEYMAILETEMFKQLIAESKQHWTNLTETVFDLLGAMIFWIIVALAVGAVFYNLFIAEHTLLWHLWHLVYH